jgi:hypothetical protein
MVDTRRARGAPVQRVTRSFDLHLGRLVRITWILIRFLVYLPRQAATVLNLLRPDHGHSARRLLVN